MLTRNFPLFEVYSRLTEVKKKSNLLPLLLKSASLEKWALWNVTKGTSLPHHHHRLIKATAKLVTTPFAASSLFPNRLERAKHQVSLKLNEAVNSVLNMLFGGHLSENLVMTEAGAAPLLSWMKDKHSKKGGSNMSPLFWTLTLQIYWEFRRPETVISRLEWTRRPLLLLLLPSSLPAVSGCFRRGLDWAGRQSAAGLVSGGRLSVSDTSGGGAKRGAARSDSIRGHLRVHLQQISLQVRRWDCTQRLGLQLERVIAHVPRDDSVAFYRYGKFIIVLKLLPLISASCF